MGSLLSQFLRKTGNKLIIFLSFSLFFGNSVYSQCSVEAAFSYTQDCNTITFQNNSSANSGLIAGYFWDFGDGTTSVLENPQPHVFPPDNNYTVVLSVTDTSGCIDSDTAVIQIGPSLVADFNYAFNSCATVFFTNLSPLNLNYYWDFGDGTNSTQRTPNDHFYGPVTNTTIYNITLTISDTNGCIDSIVKPVTIYPPISADFTVQNNNQCSNAPVNFDASTSTGVVTYQWDFGDGNNLISNFNPLAQHQYYSYFDNACTPDTSYNVSLMVSNPNMCFDYTSTNLTLLRRAQPLLNDPDNPSKPFSNCSNNPTPSNPDYTITVENMTDMNCVDSLSIDWGDGSNVSGLLDTDFPLTHTYTSLGVFQLNVAAYSGNGCTGDTTYLVGNQSIPASVGINTPDNTVGCAPQEFWFEMTGWENNSPGTSYLWTFGDNTDTITWNYNDPINNGDTIFHTYTDAACNITGTPDYDVTLTVKNLCMSRTTVVGGMYVQAPAQVEAESSVDTLCVDAEICFNNLSTPGWGGYTECDSSTFWTWHFGDGNSEPSLIGDSSCYFYDKPGTYTVQLIGDPQASTCGNVDTAFQITVIDIHPEFTADTVCLGDPTPFTDLSYVFSDTTYTPDYNIPVTSWYWNFGDNNSSNLQNPSHTYANPGEYIVSLTVGSAFGCDTTYTDTVFVDHVEIDSLEVNDLTCHDANDGSIYVYASYGTNNITYTLNPGPIVNTTGEFTNLEPGTYYLDVQNARGCDRQDTIIINNPPEIVIDSIITEDITCSGDNNGEITIIASGGTGTLYYTLLPDNITNTNGNFDNLGGGTYTVSITDDNNCGPVITPDILINDPLPLVIDSLSTTNISCNGQNDGEIFIQASGGTGVITYTLMPGNVSNNTGSFSALTPGTYNIEITDENNCSINSGDITITGANELEIETVDSQDISCNGLNDGSISVTATGGTGALTYTLQPNGISNMTGYFNNLSGGTYFVEVVDQNGCSVASSDININDPDIISILTENFTDISCNGANNGSITIVATGGTGILTYTLMPGNISNTTGIFNNLAGGTYTVSVTDQNSCNPAISTNIQILDPASITLDSLLVTDLGCYGQNTGSIYVEGNGGTGNLSYTINPGGGSNNTGLFENLAAGSYTIDITDDNNCSFTTSPITINSPAELLFDNVNSTDISCNGATDGTITTTASGGTGVITYTLNPTGTSNTTGIFDNLPAGTYNITATDENSCEITSADIEILEPAAISISSEAYTDISCHGADDGTISIIATGGTGNLQYTLQPNNITNTSGSFNNLTAGSYTVSITDDNNCGPVVSSEITITDPPALVIDSETATNSTCNGCDDGTIEVLASGGTGVLTYTLNPDGISNTTGLFTNLAPGSYSVDVEDENGCRISSSNLIINEPGVFSIDSINVVDVSCHDYNDGSISVYVSGGVTPYTFTLNPDGITNGTGIFNNLISGNYTVTITDGNGYSITTNQLTVDNPPAIVIDSVQSENITCFGNTDGIIQAYASGGTGTLNYVLLPVNDTNTTGYFGNLTAGTYQVAVTDMNACPEVISSDIIISEPTELTIISENATDMLCHDSDDGIIEVQANGGTGVLTYTLNPAGTTNNNGLFSNLSAGTYNVNVTDMNGCNINSSDLTINAPAELIFDDISSVDVSCHGLADGSVNSVASGGTGAISYMLLPDSISNSTGIFTDLQGGTYQVVVSDANNCSLTSSDIEIIEPAEVLITNGDYTDITCHGANDGSITVTAGGGSGILTYTLQPDGISNSTGIFTDLAGGTYQVTVTDENNCGPAVSSDIIITDPPALAIDSETATDATCNGCDDGTIEVVASGGTGTLSYTLNPAGTNNTTGLFSNLAPGIYTVDVEDENGCTISSSNLIINEPGMLIVDSLNVQHLSCYNSNDGSIEIFASGGIAPYTYTLNPGSISNTTGLFENLGSGSYTITITDANGIQTTTNSIELNNPDPIVMDSIQSGNITCNGANDGWINAFASGGNSLYYVLLPLNDTNTSGSFTNLTAGTYRVMAADINNCPTAISSDIVINEPAQLTIDSEITTDITCHDADDGVIEVTATGGTGVLTYTLQPQGTVNSNGIFTGLAEGTYFVTVEDENACQVTSSDLYIFNPQSISFTFSQVDITCYGANDGSISIVANGGTGAYTYSIDSGMTYQAAPDFNNLYAGTYYIMVRDSLMCETAALQVEVNQPADLFIQDFTVVDPTCNGCTNGQATANVVGGTPPYSHSWSNGATGNPLTGVGAGTYTDTVTDANGCTTFATVTLSEPQLFELSLETHNILCNGYSSGWAVAHVSGGTTPYNYEWRTIPGNNLVSTGDTLFSAAAGDYEITVTDAFNNALQQIFTLTEPSELILTTNHQDTVCYGDANGWAAANVSGGTPPYSYLWSNGAQTDSISGLSAGTYTITVTDNNNCEQTANIEIIENQELVLNTIVSDPNICNGSSTQLTASVVGGTPPYISYEWTPAAGLTDPNSASTYASPTQNTFYTVTVTDAIGCQISGTAFVEVMEVPEADFSYQYPCTDSVVYFVDESNMLNGFINDWQWDFGDGTVVNGVQNPTHIFADPGNYTVSLTVYESQNGCSDTYTRTVQIHNLPDVDFSYGATCENEAVEFFNETVADTSIQSVFWDFGDPASGNNNYSTIQNPSHTYTQAGSYIVSLTVTDHFGCSAFYSESITISEEPVASFSFTGGCANEVVQFIDQSDPVTATMNKWIWEFGDGTADTIYSPNDPNVSHLYSTAGNYLVTLTVENLGGCTNTIQHPVAVDAVPVADFSHENNCDSELVEFTDLSDPNGGNNINQWKWNFGDPASGNYNIAFTPNPVHQFSAPGTYPVRLIVSNANGCSDTIVKDVLIREGPGVDFTWDNPCVGEDTYFFPDTAVMNISEIAVWHWDFNDGIYSNEPSPVHQFPNNGVYNVELTVTDTSGCTASITHAVAVRPLPVAFFDFSEPTCSTDSVYFNDLSSTEYGYIDMWVWDFGDGSPKDTTYFPDEPHRYHNFPNEGTFFVTLEITNSFGCSNSFTDEVTVTEGPIANFYFSNACENEEVFFEDASFANGAGNIIAWDWIFDDPLSGVDNFSTEQNPSHIFSSPGSYDVRLIVTNFNNCQDTMMKTVIVKEAPLADFTWNSSCQNQAVQFSIDTTVTNINVITDWFWDFGDGITSDLMEPEHMYEGNGIYTVTLYVQDTGLCPNTITKNITVHPEPVADFDFDAPSCQDSEIQFVDLSSTASGYINKWIWNYGDGIVDTINYPATPDPIHVYDTTGNFDVTLTIVTTDSCENTVTKAISITPAPIADFEFEGSCSDAPVQFTDLSVGNGGINITQWYWDFGDPLSGQNNYSTLQNPVHIFSQPGTYSVSLIVVNTESCSDTIVQEVTSSELPDVDFVTDSANCFQDVTFFFADSTIIDIPAVAIFEWNFGDGSNPVYQQNAQHMYQLAGEYNVTLTITDTSGCMNTMLHPVEIAPKPVAEYDYKNSCAEDSTVFTDFSYTLNGDDIIAWSWNFGDPASGNANYSNEQNPAHAFAQTGLYMVKLIVTAESGCVDSVSRQIEVFQGPTAAYSYLPEPCKDGMVSFTDLSTANQTSLADWFWEFEPGYNSSLRNPVHQFQQTDTSYAVTLTVTDGRGCTSSITDTVFVPAGLEVEINSTATCFKETMFFEPELISPAGDTLLQFKWNFGDPASGINNTSTIRNPEHLFLTPGAYTVSLEAMDQNGCWTTVYKQVTVDPLPVPDFTYESFQCDSSVYFIDLSIGNGAPIDYRIWNYGDGKPADTIYDPAAVNVVHLYDEPGYYTVQLVVATTNGCMDTISKEVLRENCIQAGISIVDTLICQGFEIAFADSSSNTGMIQQWQWNFGDGADTTYNTFAPVISHRFNSPGEKIVTLYVTSQVNGSVLSDSMFIAVDVLPTPKPDFMAENVCLNQQSEFDNLTNLNNCQLDSWFWDFGIADTAVTSNEASPVYTYETADTFNVKLLVTATNGCYDSIMKETVVNPLPVADFEWELACRSLPTTFFDLSLDSLTTWSWNFGDSLTKHDTSSMRNPQYVYDSTGIYFPKLIVGNQFGCTDTLQQKIEVYPVPTSNFSYEENYDDVQGQLHLLNESEGAESYWWLFGDGGDSEEVHPVYRFTEDGEYEILLISTNEFGCPDSLKQTYNFMFKGLFVPNAFAPENPASEVRVFKPKGINLMEYELMIFDSWGHQIWSSDELDDAGMPTEGWDGTFNGKELPMDTYLWKIKAKFKDGSLWEGKSIGNNEGGSEETSGTVTLIR